MSLKTLKENEEGFGIIIESDAGFISKDFTKKYLTEGTINETLDLTKPIYYYATLQKFGVENRNGRVYPENILKREALRYQEVINRNSSFHEMDHPDCKNVNTEILTQSGWKYLKDISDDEDVLTLNPDTNQIEVQQISKKIDQPYNGKMIRIYGRNMDVTVTPNHKFWIVNKRTRIGKFVTAQDIHDKTIKSCGDYFIPKRGNWVGVDKSMVTIPGVNIRTNRFNCTDLIEKYSLDYNIDSITFYQFMGVWLSEGSITGSKGSKAKNYGIRIAQKKSENIEIIRDILDRTGLIWYESEFNGKIDFICYDARLHAYLKPLGNSKVKYIPTELKNAAPNLLNELFEMFILGDGRRRGKYSKVDVFSTSKKLVDDLHEILIKIGGSGCVREENRQFDRHIGNRLIEGKNCSNMWFLSVSSTEGIWLDNRTLKTEEVDYNDRVYCVEVPNHIWYFRENGKGSWTGNSSTISLKGGSPYRIVELIWEGNALIGKLEILVSAGYRKSGIISCNGDLLAHYLSYGMTVGISSRGVGTLKKVGGQNVVQDDFELICWDAVSSPSTPGSYLYLNLKDFKKYDEVLPTEKDELEESSDSNMDFMKKLQNFLGR